MDSFFLLATLYLGAMVVAVPLSVRLGLGSVLGYLLAGIALSPVLHLLEANPEELQHFAEFGIVMMLFLIGIELDPRTLWSMRDKLLGLGGLQVLGTMAVIAGAMVVAGFTWQVAVAIGMILALSSTAIVLQTLTEKGLMGTTGGRSSFSVLLTQDIAVIPMLTVVPLLASRPSAALDAHAAGADTHGGMSLVDGLPGWGVALVTLGAVAAVILTGRYLTGPLFRFVHMARLRELYTAVALGIVVSIALLMTLVGLSPALGAFLAGVVLANSEFRHELEADIEPFKGLLLGLFFITVGAGIDFGVLRQEAGVVLGGTLALMAVKGAILYLLGRVFGLRGRDQWLFTLSLAQAGEFGFVLIAFSMQTAVLSAALGSTLLLIVALSMLLTPLAFIAYEAIGRRMTEPAGPRQPHDDVDEQQDIIIAGIGRFGQVVNRMVQASGFRTVVLDNNLETIQLMRRFGFKGFFGDPTRPELLHAAGLQTAKVMVVAVDDTKAALQLVEYVRRARPDIHIVARAHDRLHVYELYRAGADDIVREMFDSSLRAARYVLENIGLSEFEAHQMEIAFYRHDRQLLRELSQLWRPGVPVEQNKAYVAKARELNANLETALIARLDEMTRDGDAPTGRAQPSDGSHLRQPEVRQPAE